MLLVSVALASGEKKPEKRPTKKAHSLKPTKSPKSIIEEFTALPPADVDFIKELDRQFREHGNKIRIKVERSNGTDGKNMKRTIDGDLGYGHYSNQADTGYHFSKPKYMIYPYSQHDIPPVRSTHSTHETNTYVPLPEQYYEAPKAPSPRPTKHRKTTVTPTHVTFHSTAQPEPAYHYQTYHPEQHQQHAQVHEHHEQAHAPEHQQIQYQYVAQQPSGHGGDDHETQYVYEKPVVNFVTPLPEAAHHAHQEAAYQQQQHSHHHQPPQKYPNFAEYHHHHRPQQQQEEEYLPEPKLVENYPSHKHTRVIYKSPALKTELQQEALQQHEHYHHQQQEVAAHHQQHHQQQQQQYILQEVYPSQASYFEDKSFVESAGPQVTTDRSETASPHYNTEQVVAITQKPKRLYNYHAHTSGHHGSGSRGSRMAAGGGRSRTSGSSSAKASSKRDAVASPAPYTEEEFRKVNKMVQRMKKKSRTTPADDAGMMTVTANPTSPSPRMVA
uniref:Uncharacterized protein n=1 Tax=Anopheles maculatus TaxID=74869 RepID=A0A182SBD6_9DIPT